MDVFEADHLKKHHNRLLYSLKLGRALHWHRRGGGFESRSEPEFFSGLCPSSVTAALALMTVSTQLLLMDKINFHSKTYDERNRPFYFIWEFCPGCQLY